MANGREESPIPPAQGDGEPLIGCVLRDTFRIVGCLDEGGMGKLYRAEHLRLHRPVAVKFMARSLVANPEASARFRREAEIISQLDHPHIVQVLDFDTTLQGDAYIVMELLQGMPLSQRLLNPPRLSLREASEIVAQIASGLMLAHAAGVVHRDLKPDNVFLLSMSDRRTFVKLLDFGICMGRTEGTRLTGKFHVLGTPDYMAPEQAVDSSGADHRADQWSLACIAYEILTGRPAFQADSVVALLKKVATEEPLPPTQLMPELPVAVERVLLKGLSKDPNDRYPSIGQFAEQLARATTAALTADTIAPSPSTDPERVAAQHKPTLIDRRRKRSQSRLPLQPSRHVGLQDPLAPPSPNVPGGNATRTPARQAQQGASGRPQAKIESGRIRRYSKPRLESNPVRRSASGARPGVAPTGGNSPSEHSRIAQLLDQLRASISGSDDAKSLELARSLTCMARSASVEARLVFSSGADIVQPVLLKALGGLGRALLLNRAAPSASDARIDPQQMFLYSRIADGMTIDELLDVTPLSAVETLHALLDFRDQGFLTVE